jgi:hypothetical protein
LWAVDLPRLRAGITLDEFLRVASEQIYTPTPIVRGLLDLCLLIGRHFGWDRPGPSPEATPTFADRLTDADRARSLAPAGLREGPNGLFRVIYRFENEKLVELINRTVHAAALSALVATANSYRFYFAVYVRSVGPLTPFYMAAIDPFRNVRIASWMRVCAGRQGARSRATGCIRGPVGAEASPRLMAMTRGIASSLHITPELENSARDASSGSVRSEC